MRHWATMCLFLVALAALPLANVAGAEGTPTAAIGDFAGLVDIGDGSRLFLECRGSGSPTVILEAGYRSPANVWTDDLVDPESDRTMVLEGVARFTRVCAYDRPGVAALLDGQLVPSRSDPVPMPRSAENVVADLHALLAVAEVPGPYVMVGHSLGGLFVRLYAATYPDEVLGLVLVDAWSEQLKTLLTPDEWEQYVRVNSIVAPQLAGYHDYETLDFAAASAAMEQANSAHPLGALPLAVIAHGEIFALTDKELGFSLVVLETAWRTAQEGLATLTPDARIAIATESSHYVQLQQPNLVIDAVREVVDAVRDPASWQGTPPAA